MTLEQILLELNKEIETQYGVKSAVHTVILDPKAFDDIIFYLFRSDDFKHKYRPSDINNMQIAGVKVLARTRKDTP